jgi:hypothetical protein
MEILHAALSSIAQDYLPVHVGNRACRQMVRRTWQHPGTGAADASDPRAGRIIGALRRLIPAIGFLTHRCEVPTAVIALKTVTRFKELGDKTFPESFLGRIAVQHPLGRSRHQPVCPV